MTDDQQFVVALVGVAAGVVTQLLVYRKTVQTHDLVNGMTKTNTRRSRRAAVVGERARVASAASDAASAEADMPQNRSTTHDRPPSP